MMELTREIVDAVLDVQRDEFFDQEIGSEKLRAFSTAVRSSAVFSRWLDNQVTILNADVAPLRVRVMGIAICAMYAGWQARETAFANQQLDEMFKERDETPHDDRT